MNTYTQIHIQCVFAVKYRAAVIHPSWQDRLHRYMIAIVQNKGHKVLAINSMPDHVHLLFGMRPTESLADIMKAVKGDSSEWINNENLTQGKFKWQEGYGAFSYSKSSLPTVIRYIVNQQEHHRNATFLREYEALLKEFEIDYDRRYIFTDLE